MTANLASFIPVPPHSHFPIQNLPFGVFHTANARVPRVGVAIGEWVLDLSVLEHKGLLVAPNAAGTVFDKRSLNDFMRLGRESWQAVRTCLTKLLSKNEPTLRDDTSLRNKCLFPMSDVELLLPVAIGDYTDFYSSKHHATNVGTIIRGAENALQENWLHLPVAYHGRASSVVVSGTDVVRPCGQSGPGKFGPSRAIDFELEMGFFIGPGSALGEPIPIDQSAEHVFGMVLVNDWSARDIQKWEYVPLGPFLSKSFATSISPWVVTMDALEPFRAPMPNQDPLPLPYLNWSDDRCYDIQLEVHLTTQQSPARQRITSSNYRNLYWSAAQQLAHHTVSGCDLRTGDLLASGTISGPEKESRGCLFELTWAGSEPLELANGERRIFLEDQDTVSMAACCQGDGYRVGFGEVKGKLLPARMSS